MLLFVWPPRQLLPPSLEPIKRIKNLCTKNHLLNTLAILLLYKNNPTTTREPDEVQPCSGLTCPAWKRGVSLAHLLVTSSPAASSGEEHLSRGGASVVRGGEPGPSIGTRLGLRGKNGNQLFSILFLVEKTIHFFLDTVSPYFLFSLERLTVSVALGNSLERRTSPGLLLGP